MVKSSKKMKTPNKGAESAKKVTIVAESPKTPKNKPLKTPIKQKILKGLQTNNSELISSPKSLQKKMKGNKPEEELKNVEHVTKDIIVAESPKTSNTNDSKLNSSPKSLKKKLKNKKEEKPKIMFIPEELSKQMNRNQRKRVIHKIRVKLTAIGKKDFSKLDLNEPSVKEIIDTCIKQNPNVTKVQKAEVKVMKKLLNTTNEIQMDVDDNKLVKTPKKGKKSAKSTPKSNEKV